MSNIEQVLKQQKGFYQTGVTRSVDFRINQLKILKRLITENEDSLLKALKDDLNKPEFESFGTEIGLILKEINFAIKRLGVWAKPEKVPTPLVNFPARSYIYSEPYGVILIISPWNYPFNLTFAPLVGAIAAGNCAVLKPSEYSPATSGKMAALIKEYFSTEYITVIEGEAEVSQKLLEQSFDYIFYTGNTQIGKIVMQKAAEHLIPVTLELGGKSPCIVDQGINVEQAARRIIWGKLINAGQTCVAPDYLLVHKNIRKSLLKQLVLAIKDLYGENPALSPDYGRIINQKHFERLVSLINRTEGKLVIGGQTVKDDRYIAPTIVDGLSWDDPLMSEEIFGPVLPLIEYLDPEEMIKNIRDLSKPLALYLFTEDSVLQKRVLEEVPFGGGCINDTVMQLSSPYLPFGGIGSSGIGSYHGKASFDTFTYKKSIIKKSTRIDIPFRYPPYGNIPGFLRKLVNKLLTSSRF